MGAIVGSHKKERKKGEEEKKERGESNERGGRARVSERGWERDNTEKDGER